MLHSELTRFGLTHRQSLVFLDLLKHGKSYVSTVGKRTGMTRDVARKTALELLDFGLVKKADHKNAFLFFAEPPEKLLYQLENQRSILETKMKEALAIVDLLKRIHDPSCVVPEVRTFEGLEGLKKIYEDTLHEKKTIYAVENAQAMEPKLKKYLLSDYVPKRTQQDIFAYVITPENSLHKKHRKKDRELKRETKFFKADEFPMEMELNIYGDKVAVMSYDPNEMFGLIIKSERISRSLKSLFDQCWGHAK